MKGKQRHDGDDPNVQHKAGGPDPAGKTSTKQPKSRETRWDVRDLGTVSICTVKDDGFPYRDVPLALAEGESVLGVTLSSPPAVPLPVSIFDDARCIPVVMLYAGIGGFSLGVPPSLNGYKLVTALAIEGDPTICESHRLTHPDIPCVCHMLEDRDVSLGIIERFLPFRYWKRAWVHASPSCRQASAVNLNRNEEGATVHTQWAIDLMEGMRVAVWTLEQSPMLFPAFKNRYPFLRTMKLQEFCRLPQERLRLIAFNRILQFEWRAEPAMTVRQTIVHRDE